MGLMDFFKRTNPMDEGLQAYEASENALLIDVREDYEYQSGHIPGSLNIPLGRIDTVAEYLRGADAPLFVYCQSGARSRAASSTLHRLGYKQVTDLGGIYRYHGKVEY